MSGYALHAKAMLDSASKSPAEILGIPTKSLPLAKRDIELKPRLPTKRKRDSICGLGSFTTSLTIKPCPESPYDKPETFKPTRVIGRSQLPLTFLDTASDTTFATNRLFSGFIALLEEQHDVAKKENEAPKVLIARYGTNKALYAVERVQSRVYSLCKLAEWLKEKDVADLWDPLNLNLYPPTPKVEIAQPEGAQWWQHAVVQTEPAQRPAKRARLSMLRVKPESHETVPAIQEPAGLEPESIPMPAEDTQPSNMPDELPEIPMEAPSSQQQLETLIQQYLDAVYLSKTSLAYFAKGPIARIRNAFTSPEEGAPPTYELVTALRSMLLSHKASDKKYTSKLPEIIKALPPGIYSDDELFASSARPKKSKKKLKLNRDGVYPNEEDIVKRWWISETPNAEVRGEENIEQRIKRRIGDLRVREALAQMILILEITVLEALATYKGPPEEDEAAGGEAETQGETQAKPKKRKKKLDDVKLQLDLLLDKLCIWQSVDQAGILDFESRAKDDNGTTASGKASDRLQSFCVEVIVPFYVSRLPEQARMINKKLGGPSLSSPAKRKAMRPPATSRKSESKEPDKKKSRRTFARVATDTQAQAATRKRTPSLHRSATDSQIKREDSEQPLATIPFQRSPSNAARQSLSSRFQHLKGRQIDLSAPSAAAAAKIQQKKRVEEDLKDAISALKKPNRGLAVGGYVDDLEKRGLGMSNKGKKTGSASRKALEDIQVTATPKMGKRTKDVIEATPSHGQIRNPFVTVHDDDLPTSSFCIPSSGVRAPVPVVPGTVQRSGVVRRDVGPGGIAETPSRGPLSKSVDDLGGVRKALFATPARVFASSPPDRLKETLGPVFATPIKKTTSAPMEQESYTPQPVFATPLKTGQPTAIPASPLPSSSQQAAGNDKDIYAALGWDDEDDLF